MKRTLVLFGALLVLSGFASLTTALTQDQAESRHGYFKDDYTGIKQSYFKEKVLNVLTECKVTPENSPDVYTCMKKTYEEMKTLSSLDKKEMYMNALKIMRTFLACFDSVTAEQKTCLSEKKKKVVEMMVEKMNMYQNMMDKILLSCGIDETNTPAIVNCIKPKTAKLKTLTPTLLTDPTAAEEAWTLVEELKKCPESKPEIMECIKEKKSLMFSNSMHSVKTRLGEVLTKCEVTKESAETIYSCVRTPMMKMRLLRIKDFSDPAIKQAEHDLLRKEALKCFDNVDEETKNCLKEEAKTLFKLYTSRNKFDIDEIKKRMDSMYAGCGITTENTPTLKICLDDINNIVVTQIKPWLPMTDETRQKLKDLGNKYWLCFEDRHKVQKKCLTNIVDGFKKLKESRWNAPQFDMENIKTDVLACSKNKCFREHVEDIAILMKNYESYGNNDAMLKKARLLLTQALLCFASNTETENEIVFACFKSQSQSLKRFVDKFLEMKRGVSSRKKREVEDDTEDEKPFWALFEEGEITNNQQTSIFRLLFNDKSMTRIQGLINLMNAFTSNCANWAPPPEDMRNGELFDKPDPSPKLDANFLQCKNMYDDMISFIDTGDGYEKYLKETDDEPHDKHHVSKSIIIAACVGGIIASILIHLLIVVACMMRRRCGKNAPAQQTTLPTAPQTTVPSVYSNFPSKELSVAGLPPSYMETVDQEKVNQSVAAYSQILHSSTKEGAEKSC